MTERQKRFCYEYVVKGNATQAARAAGYSDKSAYSQGQRMLKNVETQSFIKELAAPSENQSIAAAREVLEFLTDIMRDNEMPLQYRMRAAEDLAKRLGLDKPEDSATKEQENKIDEIITALNGYTEARANPRKISQDGQELKTGTTYSRNARKRI